MLAWIIVGGLVIAAPGPKDPPKKGPALVGEWTRVSYTFAGQARPVGDPPLTYAFTAAGEWAMYRGARKPGDRAGAYAADPTLDPPAIDLTPEPGRGGDRPIRGIYRIEGDTLTLCVSHGGGARPASFESNVANGTTVYVFKRVRPGD